MSAVMDRLRYRERAARVGFVIDTLQPGSGTENQLLLLLRHFDRQRTVPALCCLWDNPALDGLDAGCRVELLDFHRLYSTRGLRGLSRLRSWVRREMLDLVVTFFRDANLAGTIGGWSTGTPVISSRRNLGQGYWHTRWELTKLRALNRLTSGYVANSRAVADYTARVEGVDPKLIEVIPNAIDIDRFRPARAGERAKLRMELGFLANELLICCVANLRPIKGHDLLLDAFARVLTTFPDAMPRLLLVGEGNERQRLELRCRELGIAGRVTFLGCRTDGERVLRCADIGVLSSKAESLSNALLEYLASGLPAVATQVGGNHELVIDGETGRLVPPADVGAMAAALEELLKDEHTRKQLGRNARRTAERRFSIPAVLDHWHDFFAQQAGLLQGGRR